MDIKVKGYLERAENKLILTKANFELSIEPKLKEIMNIQANRTFFNDVISESYYAIFYCAKAYLIIQGIETNAPEEHKKTYDKFKEIVESK